MKTTTFILAILASFLFAPGCDKDPFYTEPETYTEPEPENEPGADNEPDAGAETEPDGIFNPQGEFYLRNKSIYSLADEGNFMWAVTDSFLVKLDKSTEEPFFYPLPKIVYGLHYGLEIDNNGVKWLLCIGVGLYQFDENQWMKTGIDGNQWFTGFEIDDENTIWGGTIGGLFRFDGDNWTHYTHNNSGLPYYSVGHIAIDKKRNIWFVGSNEILTPSHTLVKYDGANWTDYPRGFGESFLQLTVDGIGNVWVLTRHAETELNSLLKFDGNDWSTVCTLDPGFSTGYQLNLAIENNTIFWFGSENGIARFDGLNWTIFNTVNSDLPSNNVTVIVIDEAGKKWIGTDKGLAVF